MLVGRNKLLMLLRGRNWPQDIFLGQELSGISALERYNCNSLTAWTEVTSCFSNYQCLALSQLISLTFDYVDIHVITLVDYVATQQLEYFGASKETGKRKDVHNKTSQLE